MGEASKGNGRGKEGTLAAKLSAARSYRLSVGTGGDGTSSEAWLCISGCPQYSVTHATAPQGHNSKLTNHDGSVNAETWEPLGLPSRGQCSSSGRDQQGSLLPESAFAQSVLEAVGVRKCCP